MSLLAGNPAPVQEADLYRADFEGVATRAGEPGWLAALRQQAFARFQELGFPTTRQEDWRFTSVAPIARTAFAPAVEAEGARVRPGDLALATFGQAAGARQTVFVFVNGRYTRELSTPGDVDGVEIRSLREVVEREPERLEGALARPLDPGGSAFAALNTAFLDDGVFVSVPAGAVLAEPIHLVFFSTRGGRPRPTVTYPRTLVRAGRASQLTLVESYVGPEGEAYFTNAVSEVVLEDGAVVDHYKIQRESTSAFHVAALGVIQGRQSSFSSHSIALGGALVRNDIDQVFEGEGAECVLSGLFMGAGRQHLDTHTRIDHAKPRCASRELYKGILDGQARGVFVGRILVRPGALKTDAWQVNKNLLLSREALVDSLPQLEILADDVKCKHGSTTGQLDPAALFYLRSRGLSEAASRSLLIYAFASDLVGRIKVEALRVGLEQYLRSHLPSPLDADMKEAVL